MPLALRNHLPLKIIFTVSLLFHLTMGALAHSPLKATVPADKATLDAAPDGLQMTFAKPARMTKIVLTHSKGGTAKADRLVLPSKKFQKKFLLAPKYDGPGHYQVEWRALGQDGHALKGTFGFTVAGE